MTEWHDIDEKPNEPLQGILYYGRVVFRDWETDEVVTFPAYRDERTHLAFWDGKGWFHNGTGHDVFEDFSGDLSEENLPTHWMPLPEPPK